MAFTYHWKKTGNGKELWISCSSKPSLYQVRMMEKTPQLFLPFTLEKDCLIYRIASSSSLVPLKAWLDTLRAGETMKLQEAFFKAIYDTPSRLETYLLDPAQLLQKPEWIFWDLEGQQLRWCYLPWERPPDAACGLESLCRYLWMLAARCGMPDIFWQQLGRLSAWVFCPDKLPALPPADGFAGAASINRASQEQLPEGVTSSNASVPKGPETNSAQKEASYKAMRQLQIQQALDDLRGEDSRLSLPGSDQNLYQNSYRDLYQHSSRNADKDTYQNPYLPELKLRKISDANVRNRRFWRKVKKALPIEIKD
ncbi:MAG: hypothetical protein J6P72_09790 [Firmicutes bacterium]|nr:hypothetical protein [Bacillota bacterium]